MLGRTLGNGCAVTFHLDDEQLKQCDPFTIEIACTRPFDGIIIETKPNRFLHVPQPEYVARPKCELNSLKIRDVSGKHGSLQPVSPRCRIRDRLKKTPAKEEFIPNFRSGG